MLTFFGTIKMAFFLVQNVKDRFAFNTLHKMGLNAFQN